MSDRQTRLEELLAYQQQVLDALNQTVIEQQATLDAVRQDQERLKRAVTRLVERQEAAEPTPDERPPHY